MLEVGMRSCFGELRDVFLKRQRRQEGDLLRGRDIQCFVMPRAPYNFICIHSEGRTCVAVLFLLFDRSPSRFESFVHCAASRCVAETRPNYLHLDYGSYSSCNFESITQLLEFTLGITSLPPHSLALQWWPGNLCEPDTVRVMPSDCKQ